MGNRRINVTLDQETWDEMHASGKPPAELIRRGLSTLAGSERQPGGDEIRAAGEERERLLSSFGRRIENLASSNEELAAANRGLLRLLTEGYTLTPPVQAGEQIIYPPQPDPHEAHTVDGPRNCRRCQMLRDNAHWMESEVTRLAEVQRREYSGGSGGGGGDGSGDVGGYSVSQEMPEIDPRTWRASGGGGSGGNSKSTDAGSSASGGGGSGGG